MADLVMEFLRIVGVDVVPPSNMAELIPYLLQIGVGLALVLGVFAVIGMLVKVMGDWRRW